MDDDERQALRAEGLDPDSPDVRAAIDLVLWATPQPGGQHHTDTPTCFRIGVTEPP
jgi:hypothetical protein